MFGLAHASVGHTSAGHASVGHASSDGDWSTLAQRCAAELGPRGTCGTLGILYATEALAADLSSILTFLRERTGVPHWVGAIGPAICATGAEYEDEPALAVLTAELPPEAFRVLPAVGAGQRDDDLKAWMARAHPRFGVVHGNPLDEDTLLALDVVAAAGELFLVGALTSPVNHAQIADTVNDGALSGVLFASDVAVATGLTQSCMPIGAMHAVSAARDNVIESLDGVRAMDVLQADLEAGGADGAAFDGTVEAGLAVAGSDTNDYMVRNLVGIDPDNGRVAIGSDVTTGDRVVFVRRDRLAAVADMERMLDDVRRRADGEIRGALYHSCMARGSTLFGDGAVEARMIQDALGDVPMIGVFGNGEFSASRLYTYTGVLTLFL